MFNLVAGPGGAVGNTLVDHPDVQAVSFTGSQRHRHGAEPARGEARHQGHRARWAARTRSWCWTTPTSSSPSTGILQGAFGSTGQRCTATSRVVVQRGVAAQLVERLVAGAKKLKVGNGLEDGIDMGPAVDESQLKTDLEYIEIAQERGREAA